MLEFSGVMKGKCGLLTSVLPSLAAFLRVGESLRLATIARRVCHSSSPLSKLLASHAKASVPFPARMKNTAGFVVSR